MSEFTQGIQGTICVLIALTGATLTWFGGRDRNYLGIRARIWGRFIAPFTFCTLVILLSLWTGKFSWWFLTSYPAYWAAHTMGWGGDSLWHKILRRSLWSVVRVAASISFALFAGAWTLFVLQMIIGFTAANVLGTRNPLKAPQEEGAINFLNIVLVPFMVI